MEMGIVAIILAVVMAFGMVALMLLFIGIQTYIDVSNYRQKNSVPIHRSYPYMPPVINGSNPMLIDPIPASILQDGTIEPHEPLIAPLEQSGMKAMIWVAARA